MNWKPLGRKRARIIMRRLKEIRQDATMEHAEFDPFAGEASITPMIRDKTRLWRNSWIIRPLEDIIAEFEEVYKLVGDDA